MTAPLMNTADYLDAQDHPTMPIITHDCGRVVVDGYAVRSRAIRRLPNGGAEAKCRCKAWVWVPLTYTRVAHGGHSVIEHVHCACGRAVYDGMAIRSRVVRVMADGSVHAKCRCKRHVVVPFRLVLAG